MTSTIMHSSDGEGRVGVIDVERSSRHVGQHSIAQCSIADDHLLPYLLHYAVGQKEGALVEVGLDEMPGV